jgi:hypothetical protein
VVFTHTRLAVAADLAFFVRAGAFWIHLSTSKKSNTGIRPETEVSGRAAARLLLIGLVQQPGWLSHKSRRFGVFLAEIRQICCFSAEVVQ